jgi:hypothetical protein
MGGHGHHAKIDHNPVISHYKHEMHHGMEDFKVPDWKQYKVSNAPLLVEVEKRLAAKGLKDPWLRYKTKTKISFFYYIFYLIETMFGGMINNLEL